MNDIFLNKESVNDIYGVDIYIYIYIYMVYIYVYMYIYICIYMISCEARTSWPAPSASLQPIGFDGARPSTSVPLGSARKI